MKVLMISLDRDMLDPASRSFKRMRAYADFVDELHIVVPSPSASSASPFSVGNCTVYAAYSRFRPGYLMSAYRLSSSILRDRSFVPADGRITAQDAFPAGIIAWVLRLATGIPFELQAHAPFFDRRFIFGSPFQFIQYVTGRFLYPRADRVRAVSRIIASYLVERLRIPAARVSTIPVFSDFPLQRASLPDGPYRAAHPRFRFIICIVARFVPEKNIAMAIRAAASLSADYPDIGWIVMGAGPEEAQLRRLAASLGAAVVFEPWSSDPSDLYRSSDLYICTSWYEGWGLGIVEAVRSGTPVVTTLVGCVPELLSDSESRIIVPFGDSEALASAVVSLYRDPARRATMARAASSAAYAAYEDSRSHALRVTEAWGAMTSP